MQIGGGSMLNLASQLLCESMLFPCGNMSQGGNHTLVRFET